MTKLLRSDRKWRGALLATLTLLCAACAEGMKLGDPTALYPINVTSLGPVVLTSLSTPARGAYVPSLKERPPPSLLSTWGEYGLPLNGTAGGICGTPVQVGNIRGQLIVFQHRLDGRGPAGRGDYRIEIPQERIAHAATGGMTVAYESYIGGDGEEYYAWIAVLNATCIDSD